MAHKNNFKGYLTVLSGILLHLFIGNLYLWGNISVYVVSYFHHLGDTEATLRRAVLCIPLSWAISCLMNPVGAYL